MGPREVKDPALPGERCACTVPGMLALFHCRWCTALGAGVCRRRAKYRALQHLSGEMYAARIGKAALLDGAS